MQEGGLCKFDSNQDIDSIVGYYGELISFSNLYSLTILIVNMHLHFMNIIDNGVVFCQRLNKINEKKLFIS